MMKMLLASLLLVLAPGFSYAGDTPADKSRCEDLKRIYKEQSGWHRDAFRLKIDSSVSAQTRFEASYFGAKKIVSLIEEMEALAGMKDSDPLLKDAHRLFAAIEANDITPQSAQPVLTSSLVKLSDKMSDVISRAESLTGCELSPPAICENPTATCPHLRSSGTSLLPAKKTGNQ